MKSEFESREAFECIFGDESEIDLSKDKTGEYSFQPSRFAYSFFLVAWQYRQTEVDKLKLQVAEMKSRLNDAYTDGQSAMYAARQSKVDELQKRVDAAFRVLSQLNALDDEAWKRWKREACTFSQGESNAYEHSVRLLEQALKGGSND